ncbi:DUF47 family protein [Candidatus Bathyarchaeota archaeon]|nr:DUF47 family protein [Candidatus Bathyarchaeota archaeon]
MVFPIESEDRTMRKLLMLCQDNARLVVESYRKSLVIFDSLIKDDPKAGAPQIEEIRKILLETTTLRNTLIHELNEIGGILISRDDFLRLVSCFTDMLDLIEGISVLLNEVKTRNWVPDEKIVNDLIRMADLSFDSQLKLRDGIMSLGYNSEKAIGFSKEIDEIERKVDVLFIQLDLDILMSSNEFIRILLLREIAKKLDELVNKVKDASDLVRIIAL